MLEVRYEKSFLEFIEKIKDNLMKDKVKKQIIKILNNPEIGKPMRYDRKETREVYVSPFRISYIFLKKEQIIVFLDIYHKDKQ
jgi:mRNA-degrading endonuclease RelE of RelBE toxin-antitoxin system